MYDSDKRKFLSALSHGAIFFSGLVISVAIPIIILMISDDPIVKDNAKESINFHINVWLYETLIGVASFLSFGLLGLILFPLWFLIHWSLTIVAILSVLRQPNESYRYPLIFRLI